MKTFVEIHVIQNFAPSNLNRDDTGAPKDAFFGGRRRARISSQCTKQSVRRYFEAKKKEGLLKDFDLAIRTKRLMEKLVVLLKEKGRDEKKAKEKITIAINSLGFKFKENGKTEYLMFLGEKEITKLSEIIHEKWDEIGDPKARIEVLKKSIEEKLMIKPEEKQEKMAVIWEILKIDGDKVSDDKITAVENCSEKITECLNKNIEQIKGPVQEGSKKRKKSEYADWRKEIEEILKEGGKDLSALGKVLQKVMDGGKAVDLALFGRMLADMPEKDQHASCQVAHAISTHAVEREFDFYTAIDDLKPEDTAGSDMMGTVEFNSACFYRYAVVDFEKLVDNLQKDNELALAGLSAFLEGFIVSEPTGKQNSFAAHNHPEYVLISVRKSGAPRNLANAFEVPVRVKGEDSLIKKSAECLGIKYNKLKDAYGDEGNAFFMDVIDSGVKIGNEKKSLKKLLDAVISDVNK